MLKYVKFLPILLFTLFLHKTQKARMTQHLTHKLFQWRDEDTFSARTKVNKWGGEI